MVEEVLDKQGKGMAEAAVAATEADSVEGTVAPGKHLQLGMVAGWQHTSGLAMQVVDKKPLGQEPAVVVAVAFVDYSSLL